MDEGVYTQAGGEMPGKLVHTRGAPSAKVMTQNCAMPDCMAHCGVFTRDGKDVSAERCREIAMLNGWLYVKPRVWVCPTCVAKVSAQLHGKTQDLIGELMRIAL